MKIRTPQLGDVYFNKKYELTIILLKECVEKDESGWLSIYSKRPGLTFVSSNLLHYDISKKFMVLLVGFK